MILKTSKYETENFKLLLKCLKCLRNLSSFSTNIFHLKNTTEILKSDKLIFSSLLTEFNLIDSQSLLYDIDQQKSFDFNDFTFALENIVNLKNFSSLNLSFIFKCNNSLIKSKMDQLLNYNFKKLNKDKYSKNGQKDD